MAIVKQNKTNETYILQSIKKSQFNGGNYEEI